MWTPSPCLQRAALPQSTDPPALFPSQNHEPLFPRQGKAFLKEGEGFKPFLCFLTGTLTIRLMSWAPSLRRRQTGRGAAGAAEEPRLMWGSEHPRGAELCSSTAQVCAAAHSPPTRLMLKQIWSTNDFKSDFILWFNSPATVQMPSTSRVSALLSNTALTLGKTFILWVFTLFTLQHY